MRNYDALFSIVQKGDTPPCLDNGRQCRGCFGWSNMLMAAKKSLIWRKGPLKCQTTGLVITVQPEN